MGKGRPKWRQAIAARGLVVAWIMVVLIDLLALVGLARLGYDDGLVRTFQSDSPHFARFQDFSQTFGGHDADYFLLLESESFADPQALLALHDFILELQLIEGVTSVISPFSLPLPDGSGTASRLNPDPTVSSDGLSLYLESAFKRQPALERFLSRDLKSALIIMQGTTEDQSELGAVINALAAETLASQGVSLTQTGFPVIRSGIVERLFNDFILLNTVGAVAGIIVAALALQSLLLAIFTAMASGTALLWVLGVMGFAGIQINVITIALPVLILVLSFSDALHLSLETRRLNREGNDDAISRAVWHVGPACILASVTTAIAFGVLALSSSALVAELGRTGAMASLLSGVAVLVVHPLLYSTLRRTKPLAQVNSGTPEPSGRFANWVFLPDLAHRRPKSFSFGALALLAIAVPLYLTAQPSFSLYENTAVDDPARVASVQIDDTFGPTGALHFSVALDPGQPLVDLKTAQATLARLAPDHNVYSLAEFGDYIQDIPSVLRARWMTSDNSTGLISLTFRYEDAESTRALITKLQSALAADSDSGSLTGSQATGLEAMTSQVSMEMLRDLNRCFLAAVLISGLLVAIWLRDPLAGLVALIPNVLPIACVGAWLAISGRGLEFTSGIALTIAFGLAVDDTLHVLNRLRLNLRGSIWAGRDAIRAAMHQVTPALVITSAVISFGLFGTLFASLPSVAYFGALSIAVFMLALVADLLVLPACLMVLSSIRKRRVAG